MWEERDRGETLHYLAAFGKPFFHCLNKVWKLVPCDFANILVFLYLLGETYLLSTGLTISTPAFCCLNVVFNRAAVKR